MEQYLGNAIFGGVLGAGMATNAVTLLAATNPEPTVLLANDGPFGIENGETDGAIGGSSDEEGAIGFDWCGSHGDGAAGGVLGFQADGGGSAGERSVTGDAGVEREEVGVVPIVEGGGMAAGTIMRDDDDWVDQVTAGLRKERAESGRTRFPEFEGEIVGGGAAGAQEPVARSCFGRSARQGRKNF